MSDRPNNLWAPWRMEYIESAIKGPEGCFICDAAEAPDDRDKLVLCRDRSALVLMNLYPYNNGHLLVAPIRHVGKLDDLTAEELSVLGELARKAVRWTDRAYSPQGYNIGLNLGRCAGAGVPDHLHFHIVPRWNGDTNFMPVLGNAKVISEGLKSSYDRLRRVIEEIEAGEGNR